MAAHRDTHVTRLEKALVIRNRALPFIRAYGRVILSGVPPREANAVETVCGTFLLYLESPFTYAILLRQWEKRTSYEKALLHQISPDLSRLPWTLEIWPDRRMDGEHWVYGNKVLNLHWSDNGSVDLVSFRRGPWPDELLTALSVTQEKPNGNG